MRGIFEPGTYRARDTGRDETYDLMFEPPRSLRGLEEIFAAHELHPNDEVILTITEDGLDLEVDKRPRRKGSAVKGEPWESVSGSKARARHDQAGAPGAPPPTADAYAEPSTATEGNTSGSNRPTFEAVPAHLQRDPIRSGRPRADRSPEEPAPFTPQDVDDADAPRMVRARRVAPRQPGQPGGPAAEDDHGRPAERRGAPASASLRPSAARRFYEDPGDPDDPYSPESLPEDAWRWERPEQPEEHGLEESSRQPGGGFFARIAEAARGALNLRGGQRGEPYEADEPYADEFYGDGYEADQHDSGDPYHGMYEAQEPYEAPDWAGHGDVPPAEDRYGDGGPRWVQTEQDDMIAQEPPARRQPPTRPPTRQPSHQVDARNEGGRSASRPDDLRPADQRPAEPRPADPRPADPRPVEPRPADLRPADPRPADPRPADPRAVEPRDAGARPAGPPPVDPRGGDPRRAQPLREDAREDAPRGEELRREEPRREEPRRAGSPGDEDAFQAQAPARRPYPQDIRRAAEAQREAEAKRAAEGAGRRPTTQADQGRSSARPEPREAPAQRETPIQREAPSQRGPRQAPGQRSGPGPSGAPPQAPAASAPRDVVVEDPDAEALDRQGAAMWDLGEGDLRSRLIRFLQHPDVPVILRTEMVARNFGLGEEVANAMLEDLTHDKIDNLVVTKVRDDTYRISRNPTQT